MYRTSEKTSLSRKMAELEDRWRKSQEDRYILELKFKEVLKGLADKNEGTKLLKIREKYYRFLDNEDRRNERNDRILRTLDKIESQANMLSAKTERLKLLKNPFYCFQLHYEAYMKRMYPSWKAELNDGGEGLSSTNKESVYPVSHKHKKGNVSYSSKRREEMDHEASKLPYHTPHNSEKSYYNNSNDVLRERNASFPETHSLSDVQSGNVMPRQSKCENNGLLTLNREISKVDINSDDKSGNSHGLSFEQEENTSKDLLNVSLSDDYPVNDSTIPVEMRKIKEEIKNRNKYSILGTKEFKEETDENQKFRVNPSVAYLYDRSDNSNVYLNNQKKEPISNENIAFGGDQNNKNVADVDVHNGRSKLRHLSSREPDVSIRAELNENRVVGGNSPEFKPSVVVTQPTPDIGKSSSEEDVSRKGIPAEDNRSKKHRYLSSGITSEAEVSDAEGIASGDDFGRKVKYSPDKATFPRQTTAIDNFQRNMEEPFQFSSSDADYDELENQMAALVEGKRNDKSIPKVLGNSRFEKSSVDENLTDQTGDVDGFQMDDGNIKHLDVSETTEEEMDQPRKSRDDVSDISAEDHNDEVSREDETLENVISQSFVEEGGDQGVEYEEKQSNVNKTVDETRKDPSISKNHEHTETVEQLDNRREIEESIDEEKEYEIRENSADIQSEILDEDLVANTLQAEEARYEVQNINKSNSLDENIVCEEEYEEQEENVEQQEEEGDKYDDERENKYKIEQSEELEGEFETEQEMENENRKYFEKEEDAEGNEYADARENNYQVEQKEENEEEFDQDMEKGERKYVEDEQEDQYELSQNIDEKYEEQMEEEDATVQRDNVLEERETIRHKEGLDERKEALEEEENYLQNERCKEIEEENNVVMEEEGEYERRDVVEEQEVGEYERCDVIEEQDEEEYERCNVIEANERHAIMEEENGVKNERGGVIECEREEINEENEVQDEMVTEESRYVEDSEDKVIEDEEELPEEIKEGKTDRSYEEREQGSDREVNEDDNTKQERDNEKSMHEKEVYEGEQDDEGHHKSLVEDIEKNEKEHYEEEKQDDLKSDSGVTKKENLQETEVKQEEECDLQSNRDALVKEGNYEKKYEEIAEVPLGKGGPETRSINQETPNEQVKDVKKHREETQKDKKENVRKETQSVVAEHHPVQKAERNLKENPNVTSRQLTRQSSKKDMVGHDPQKTEKLKSTVRKFQMKKDGRSEKTVRKSTESKK